MVSNDLLTGFVVGFLTCASLFGYWNMFKTPTPDEEDDQCQKK